MMARRPTNLDGLHGVATAPGTSPPNQGPKVGVKDSHSTYLDRPRDQKKTRADKQVPQSISVIGASVIVDSSILNKQAWPRFTLPSGQVAFIITESWGLSSKEVGRVIERAMRIYGDNITSITRMQAEALLALEDLPATSGYPLQEKTRESLIDFDATSEYIIDFMSNSTARLKAVAADFGLPVHVAKRVLEAARETTDHAEAEPHAGGESGAGDDLDLSPLQVAAVIEDSTLGRLRRRYDDLLGNISIPADGFKTKEQVRAAGRLVSTYRNLRKRQIGLGLAPLPQDQRVTEAQRMREAFYWKERQARTTAASPRRRPKAATLG